MSSPTDEKVFPGSDAVRRANARARLARILGILAAAVALGFFAAFLIQAGLFAGFAPGPPSAPVGPDSSDQITASHSTLTGFDRERQPYEVSAESGHQDKDQPNLVHLERISATFRKTTGEVYDVTARRGLYDTKIKELELSGDVKIVEQGRFTARMERAHVVVEEKKLTSDTAIAVTLVDGSIEAHGLEISNDGRTILFLNGVKARFGLGVQQGEGGQ
ncbi:MAG: LPS export ABC transporter periplasmic protein LptC [Hyphomicrobiales bacterium]